MVATATRRPTYDRWLRAVARARAESIAVLAYDGARALVSNSAGTGAYLVVGGRCSCPAGEAGDTCCKHLAALHLYLESTEPDPPAPARRVKRTVWTAAGKTECWVEYVA